MELYLLVVSHTMQNHCIYSYTIDIIICTVNAKQTHIHILQCTMDANDDRG